MAKKSKEGKLAKSKLCCTKCTKCKGVSKPRLLKLVGQFGSLEELHDKYVCRTCRKALNIRADGKVLPEKRKNKAKLSSQYEKDEKGEYILPDHLKNHIASEPKKCTAESLKACITCHRPDVWYDNARKFKLETGACNGCMFFAEACGDPSRNVVNEDDYREGRIKKVKKVKAYSGSGNLESKPNINKNMGNGLTCVKCNTFKGVTPDRMAKLVDKFGSEEQLKAGFMCRDCKKGV